MGLIGYWHVWEFLIAMENETGEMCSIISSIYGISLCKNNTSWVKLIVALMHAICMDNIGQFVTCSLIVLMPK